MIKYYKFIGLFTFIYFYFILFYLNNFYFFNLRLNKMNFLNNSSSESMKALTEKVIKADLSSRKRRSVANRAGKMSPILLFQGPEVAGFH